MSAISLAQLTTSSCGSPSNEKNKPTTIEAAKAAFKNLSLQLGSLQSLTLLPSSQEQPTLRIASSSIQSQFAHRTEGLDAQKELERIEQPSMSAILRLCFLATIDEENPTKKVPFTNQDLAAFVLSKKTRDRTYRWFILGMAPIAVLSAVGCFSAVFWPDSLVAQASLNTSMQVGVAALGILFTGYHPDISQDCLNEKVDKLNRVKKELDEVARSLLTFCFYKTASVRRLAQIAAEEINMNWVEKSATLVQYAITRQDIIPSLDLLSQAIAYIKDGIAPSSPELVNLLSHCLKRMEEQKNRKEWEPATE